MKELLKDFIAYMERRRKSKDLWKLLREAQENARDLASVYDKVIDDAALRDECARQFAEAKERVKKLTNQIKYL